MNHRRNNAVDQTLALLTGPGFPAAIILLFSLLLSSAAQAQQEDNGSFYFPPELTVAATGKDGQTGDPGIRMQEYLIYNTAPLLPIIFFDAGAIQPPKRYALFFNSLETDSYTDSSGIEAWGEVNMQHDALNIIGYRMRNLPGTTLQLEGGYSTEPGEDSSVAAERTQVIREYLVNVWKIDPGRITLLPSRQMCDSTDNIFRQEEARCVLLHPSNTALIRTVRYRGIAQNAPFVRLGITIRPNTPPDDVAVLEMVLQTEDSLLSRTEVEGHPDSTFYRLNGSWAAEKDQLKNVEAIEAYAVLHLKNGLTRRSNSVFLPITTTQDVIDQTPPRTPNSFSIVLPFFFAEQGALSRLQQELLRDMLEQILADTANSPATFDISIRAEAEASEDTTTSPALLSVLWSQENVLSSRLEKSLKGTPRNRPILFEDPSKPGADFVSWYFGNQGNQLQEDNRQKQALAKSDPGAEGRALLDSLLMWRGREVMDFLQNRLKGSPWRERLGEISVLLQSTAARNTEEEEYRKTHGSDNPSYFFSPEERFYRRGVIIQGYLPGGKNVGSGWED